MALSTTQPRIPMHLPMRPKLGTAASCPSSSSRTTEVPLAARCVASGNRCHMGRRGQVRPQAFTPDLVDVATSLASQLAGHLPPLAYEPVALPCSMMKCGDVVHRR